jgi:hypothetical protein
MRYYPPVLKNNVEKKEYPAQFKGTGPNEKGEK